MGIILKLRYSEQLEVTIHYIRDTKHFYLFYIYEHFNCLYVYMCVCACLQCPQRLEKDERSPGTGVKAK